MDEEDKAELDEQPEQPVQPPQQPQHTGEHTKAVDYERAFEMTGHGMFNHIVLVSCSLIYNHSLLEMVGIAYIVTPAECDLHLTVSQKSLISSAIFIGIIITAIFWGVTSDNFGRRKVMLPALIATVISSFVSSLCTSFWSMFAMRFITGIFASASCATVLVYLGEMHMHDYRNKAITWSITSAQIAFTLLPALGWIIIPRPWEFSIGKLVVRPWRIFMWMWGIVGLAGAALLFLLPESPRFTLASKGSAATLQILSKMYAWNYKTHPSQFPVKTLKSAMHLHSGVSWKEVLDDMKELLKAPMRQCFLITHFCMFLVFLLTNGIYMWMPDFINEMLDDIGSKTSVCDMIRSKYVGGRPRDIQEYGHDDGEEEHPIEDDCTVGEVNPHVYPISIVMELVYLVPFLAVIYVIDTFDKRKLYRLIMLICAAGTVCCCVIPQITVAMIFLIIGLCTGSCAAILTALSVEAFPTSLRALSTSTMYMSGQLGSIVGASIIVIMHGIWCQVLFVTIAVLIIISVIVLRTMWPDMEEVRSIMEDRDFTY